MKNPYLTKEFKPIFNLKQAEELLNSLDSIRVYQGTVSKIAFGSHMDTDEAIFNAGLIPTFVLSTSNESLIDGVIEKYGFPVSVSIRGILLDNQGNYLFNLYDEHDDYFDPPLEPLLVVVDLKRQEFILQYSYGICIFGDITGTLYCIRMD